MKVRFMGIIGLLVIVVAMITAPVLALTATGTSAVTGNPSSYASITLSLPSVALGSTPGTMTPGISSTNSSLDINVTCNEAFTISIADSTSRGSHLGYMGNYTSSAYDAYPVDTTLVAPLQLVGTNNATTTANSVTAPISTAQTLYTGAQPVHDAVLAPNIFTQPVAYYDPVLPAGSTYRIDYLFTLTVT